jgi:NADPH:quinone reductase
MAPALPATARAIIARPGEPLVPGDIAMPVPKAGEVLIAVAAAGLNGPDQIQRKGFYPPPPGAPETLGLEVSGTVVALGEGTDPALLGQDVCALLPGGGYATHAVAHAGSVLPVPKGLTLVQAAALPETVFTVWTNVFDRAGLKPGETFLVHGGTSGIGTTAIQMAKAYGARVFATAGSDEKCALVESLGATAINYRTADFSAVLDAAGGADVVLDMVGGDYIQKNINLLRQDGRLVQIAYRNGPVASLNLMRLMLKRLTLTGSTLRPRSNDEKAAIAASVRSVVWPWIEDGLMAPVIDSTFPLADAEAAHARMDSGVHSGKIMLVV